MSADDPTAVFASVSGPTIEKLYFIGARTALAGFGLALVSVVVLLFRGPAYPVAVAGVAILAGGWAFAASMNAIMRRRFVRSLRAQGLATDVALKAWVDFRAVED